MKKPWGRAEDETIRKHYGTLGAAGMLRAGYLVDRTRQAIQKRANLLGLANYAQEAKNENADVPWPMPTMGLLEQLECVRLRTWARECASPGQLVPAIGRVAA